MTRRLTDEEEDIWRRVARTVERLHKPRPRAIEPEIKAKIPPPPPGPGPKRRAKEAGLYVPPPMPAPKPVSPPSPVPQGREIDLRTQARLKRGQLPIEGTLDLHGHRMHEAYDALRGFIAHHFNRGARCVLVIHGKGMLSGQSKIRTQMPHWLDEWPEMVLSHNYAQPQDGGTGASYILLRRKR